MRSLESDAAAIREVPTGLEPSMLDEILSIKEVAALHRLAERTPYAMANVGEIPAFEIRGQWRTKRAALDAQPRGRGGA